MNSNFVNTGVFADQAPVAQRRRRMVTAALFATTALTLLAGASQTQAQTVVNGNGGSGTVVTTDSALSSTNTGIAGPSLTVGSANTATTYTNFSTTGGTGSGGGGGLGGVFFVDSGASLTLDNVSFTNNTATGGQGGGVKVDNVGAFAFSLAGATADASALPQFTPKVSLNVSGTGAVTVSSFTLTQSSTLFGAGSGVGVVVQGQDTTVGASVSSTTLNSDGSETVNLSAPLALTGGNGLDVVIQSFGAWTFQNGNSQSSILPGMEVVVVVPGGGHSIAYVNTISYDGNNNVTSFTLKDANGNTVVMPLVAELEVINAQEYDFTRLATSVNGSSTSNQLVSTGPVGGFTKGMSVTGAGVPGGTVVTGVSYSTDPNTGATVTTVTLNNQVNLLDATNLKGATNPVVSNSGNAVLNLPNVAGLAAGETITGAGIPAGTTILSVSGSTVTLSSALQQAAINGIANGIPNGNFF